MDETTHHNLSIVARGLWLGIKNDRERIGSLMLLAQEQGHTLREIADVMGCSAMTVQRFTKAAAALKERRAMYEAPGKSWDDEADMEPGHTPPSSSTPAPMKLLDDPAGVALSYEEQMRNNEIGQRARELRAEREWNQAVRNGGRLPKPANEVYESTHGQQARYLR